MDQRTEAQTIADLAREGMVVEVNGKKYSNFDLKVVTDRRNLDMVRVQTLTGLTTFLGSSFDKEVFIPAFVLVKNYKHIVVQSEINMLTKMRDTLLEASLPENGHEFPFGRFMDCEEFIISLRSLMVQSDDQERLISYVSRLTVQNTVETQDNGISQVASVKRGISGALKDKEQAPTIVKLAPYRTFIEITQPESSFLFRLRVQDGRTPSCALFEADGGAWKNDAMERVASYLKTKVSTFIPVIF